MAPTFDLTRIFAILSFLSIFVDATTFSQSICYTKKGPSSLSTVPTSSFTLTIPITKSARSTVTPVTTITPAPVTTTYTTVTTTDTTYSSSGVLTIPPPAGFTPLAQDPDYVPKIKGRQVRPDLDEARIIARAGSSGNKQAATCKAGKVVFNPALYPVAVYCISLVEPVTTKYTATVTAHKTSTVTAATITYSVRSVVITDTTIIEPSSTYYAACATNNLVGSSNGNLGIGTVYSFASFVNTIVNSSYDCCAQCFGYNMGNCEGSLFVGQSCTLLIGQGCSPGDESQSYYQTDPNGKPDSEFIVSNGPCGGVRDDGSSS